MKLRCLIGLALLLAPVIAVAQESISSILALVQNQLTKSAQIISFESTFFQRGMGQHSMGTLTLQKENFRLSFDSNIATYSQGTLTHYDKEENTLTYSNPSGEELIQLNPFTFLSSYEQSYMVALVDKKKGQERLLFTPKGKSKIKSIELRLKNSSPKTIIVVGSTNTRLEVNINAIRPAGKLSPNYFSLKATDYPKAEVIDLR